ncbi:MAG: FHA domain-containing protein [Desulfurococcaceae archaeon]
MSKSGHGTSVFLRLETSPYLKGPFKWFLDGVGPFTIGRDLSNDVVVLDPYASRQHARIFVKDDEWFVEDLGSTNGTYLDEERLAPHEPRRLERGKEHRLRIGFTQLVVKVS